MSTALPPRFCHKGVSVDASLRTTHDDHERIRRHVDALIDRVNGPQTEANKVAMPYLLLSGGFFSLDSTNGYCALFNPTAPVDPNIIHSDRAHGCLVGVFVDLPWHDGDVPASVKDALEWAGRIGKYSLPSSSSTSTTRESSPKFGNIDPQGGTDAAEWTAEIVGHGFVGLYARASDPTEGLLVVFTHGLREYGADRRDRLIEAASGIKYSDLVSSNTDIGKRESAAREASCRNACRILHDAAARIGFADTTTRNGIVDILAVPTTAVPDATDGNVHPTGGTIDDILKALRTRPSVVVPQIKNESDIFEVGNGGVRYFDGMVSVDSSVDHLVAFRDGKPETGLLVVSRDLYRNTRPAGLQCAAFDAGIVSSADEPWAHSAWLESNAVAYKPLIVAVSSDE